MGAEGMSWMLRLQVFQPGSPAAGHMSSSLTELSLGLQGEEAKRPCRSLH